MKKPMDWEEAFAETQQWAKKGADRAERLLGAVAELIERERQLSSSVEEMARELKRHLSSPRPEAAVSKAEPEHQHPKRFGLFPIACLGFVFSVFVGLLLI